MLPEQVQSLLEPAAYPRRPVRVALIHTHISYVLIAGDDVYKIKKPVAFEFVDFSTIEKRRHFCEEEVRLNSRFCAGLYYGVEAVVATDEGLRFGAQGEVIDYAVHMRRLPSELMMDSLVEHDQVSLQKIGLVVDRLVRHYDGQAPDRIAAGTATFQRHWLECIDGLSLFAGRLFNRDDLERVESLTRKCLDANAEILRRREEAGRVKDGHGDLRCESICFDFPLPGNVCISDCIEFDASYRVADTGLDVCFLAMDLEARGRRDLANLFLGLYMPAAADLELPLVAGAFKSYRALVRARVAALATIDLEIDAADRRRAEEQAHRLLQLAEKCLIENREPCLVLVRGLSGSGKSVLAGALASRLGAVLITTDVVRKRLAGRRPIDRSPGPFGRGMYSPTESELVYGDIAREVAARLSDGQAVVVDGTYRTRAERANLLAAIAGQKVPTLIVSCTAAEALIKERQEQRRDEPWRTSDGDYEVYLGQRTSEEPVTPGEGPNIEIETARPLAGQVSFVLELLEAIGLELPA